jgi:protein SCO1/2
LRRTVLQNLALATGCIAFLVGAAIVWRQFTAGPEPAFPEALDRDLGATVIADTNSLPAFELIDHQGQPFSQARLLGFWTFVFFGYTSCPDICPTTLNTLAKAVARIRAESQSAPPQIVFVSVDPARDTAEKLAQYIAYYDTTATAVTAGDDHLLPFARSLGVGFKRHDENNSKDYLVDHTVSILLIDPKGRLYAIFSPPHDATAIARDFSRIAAR